ncbi:MAG: 5-deoxy-glucuronate isomerase [Bacillota bacterium]
MSYLYKHKEFVGFREIVKVGDKTEFTGLGLLNLNSSEVYEGKSYNKEMVLVILGGKCNITVDDKTFSQIGEREDVFSGKATSVYVPINSSFRVEEAQGKKLQAAIVMAVAENKHKPFLVSPEQVIVNTRGEENFRREVHDILVENVDEVVDRIVVGETYTFPGNWSSYPSHKHDQWNPPVENQMEEIYFFKAKPMNGFGVQCMYNDDKSLDESYIIRDGDAVAIPFGYHPVAAAPGYHIYYLWVLAGDKGRELIPKDDPELAWLLP